jgi:hypothetical protein
VGLAGRSCPDPHAIVASWTIAFGRPRLTHLLAARLAERFGDGPIEAGMRAHIITAQG